MIVYKCDRCGVECEPHKVAGYELCNMCYERFVEFLNMRDCTPEGVCRTLVEYGQHDKKIGWGDTIKYSPSEVRDILDGKYKN